MTKDNNVIYALSNSQKVGEMVAKRLNIKLSTAKKTVFADGEISIKAETTVRNKNVFVVASMGKPVNDNLMELLIFLDALKRASAKQINVVLSYYGYARQDRKAKGRQPITAKLIADLMQKAGADRVIAVDLHNPSIQGFFDIPVDDLRGQYILAPFIKKQSEKFTVVSPDHGGATRARLLAELLSNSIHIAIVDKRRTGPNKAETLGILGNVDGQNVVIIDDMIDTGGTIVKAAEALKKAGAKQILVAATHGLFSKGFNVFEECKIIDKVIVTDTIEAVYSIKSQKLEIISISDLISKSIHATSESGSIGEIYKEIKEKLK